MKKEKYIIHHLSDHPVKLNIQCPICGIDEWTNISSNGEYTECCNRCTHTLVDIWYNRDIKNTYKCHKCNCLECEIEENQKAIATRCKHCSNQQIVYQKKVTNGKVYRTNEQPIRQSNQPKCPHCNSANISTISTGERAVSVLGLGLFSKKINKSFKCKSCGYTW